MSLPAESDTLLTSDDRTVPRDSQPSRAGARDKLEHVRQRPPLLKVMTMRLEGVGGWPGVLERLIRREDLSGDEAAAALAALLRSLGFEKVTVVFEEPPAT
jgi:hypothetical protein